VRGEPKRERERERERERGRERGVFWLEFNKINFSKVYL
jgi:hypothetical protein